MDTLVEREQELAAVHEFLHGGGGAVLLVEAPAGVGKTSLLEVACRAAHDLKWDVLAARGSELEADFAFGLVRQIFERRLTRAGWDEREALLSGAAEAVRPLVLNQPIEEPASDTSFAVLHGLYWLAVNLSARRHLLITIDDAHWADEPSLRWLAYLAGRLEGLPLALLVASRPVTPASTPPPLQALREGATILRLALCRVFRRLVRRVSRRARRGARPSRHH